MTVELFAEPQFVCHVEIQDGSRKRIEVPQEEKRSHGPDRALLCRVLQFPNRARPLPAPPGLRLLLDVEHRQQKRGQRGERADQETRSLQSVLTEITAQTPHDHGRSLHARPLNRLQSARQTRRLPLLHHQSVRDHIRESDADRRYQQHRQQPR